MPEHSGPFRFALILSALLGVSGCAREAPSPADASQAPWKLSPAPVAKGKSKQPAAPPVTLSGVDLSDAVNPVVQKGPVQLAAAKDEWTSFVLQVGPRTPGASYAVRIGELRHTSGQSAVPRENVSAAHVMSMPVDVNRAGYVRHTGLDVTRWDLPRALLPLPANSDGAIDLARLRDASRPTDITASAPPSEPALLWVDVRVPEDAPPGDYEAACEALSNGQVVARVPVKLKVHDFALPRERHLNVVGQLEWEDLKRLYTDRFEAIRPRLMSRNTPAHAGAVKTIDELMVLAHRHRTSLIVPALQPTVKWPANAPPDIIWEDYDSLVAPWLKGDAFEDKRPLGFWPLPAPELLEQYVRRSQLEYWDDAATHFDQNDWLDRAPVWIEKVTAGRANEAESAELSRTAAETLAIHQRVRAAVPLEMDQLRVADPNDPPADGVPGIDAPHVLTPAMTGRLVAAAPGVVFAPPMRLWPEAAQHPAHYLRTDMPALVPYVGAGGDERDVRLWAWLAFLRQASLIHFSDALPSRTNPTDAADPNELIWFYPGEWFGLDKPVPTIQLKWLRRAQQDYEYLLLARERGDRATRINTVMMARLITKPVEIQPGQNPDPAYALMSGTTSQAAWNEAQRLLTEMILLHKPEQKTVDAARQHVTHIETLRWAQPQERPLLVGRTTEWSLDPDEKDPWLKLRFGVDLYNASDAPQEPNTLGWTAVPRASGWQIEARANGAPEIPTYNVRRATIDARFDLSKLNAAARGPMEMTFTDGFKKNESRLKVVLPVASSDRREGQLAVDGRITDDWTDTDLAHNGQLVRMLSRPGLQGQQLEPATTASKVYTTWADDHFYVAFDLAGVNPTAAARARNFVDYQFRRAWGEDLCEILIQPVSDDGLPGPTLHVVCKPNGSTWVERKGAAAPADTAPRTWQDVQAGVLHSSIAKGEQWQGEVKIPWKAILAALDDGGNKPNPRLQPPNLLRFNFVQHRSATGESASWAGPVDFGRDDSLMGVLYLRDPLDRRGPRNLVGNDELTNPATPAER